MISDYRNKEPIIHIKLRFVTIFISGFAVLSMLFLSVFAYNVLLKKNENQFLFYGSLAFCFLSLYFLFRYIKHLYKSRTVIWADHNDFYLRKFLDKEFYFKSKEIEYVISSTEHSSKSENTSIVIKLSHEREPQIFTMPFLLDTEEVLNSQFKIFLDTVSTKENIYKGDENHLNDIYFNPNTKKIEVEKEKFDWTIIFFTVLVGFIIFILKQKITK